MRNIADLEINLNMILNLLINLFIYYEYYNNRGFVCAAKQNTVGKFKYSIK